MQFSRQVKAVTLEQLRIFVVVAEQEHMTRAASTLNLTQSAVSAAISTLEARYATNLFDRVGRSIRLTDAGRQFLGEARAVLARAEAAETVLADLAGLKRGSLALAASQTIGNYWLVPHMHKYSALHPGIRLSLKIGNSEQVMEWVHTGIADLGFIEGSPTNTALAVKAVAKDKLVLVVSSSHPWASEQAPDLDQLKEAVWVTREEGSGTRQVFEEALASFGLLPNDLKCKLTLPSNESVCMAVASGAGATITSRLVANSLLESGALVAIKLSLPTRNFSLVRHKDRYVTQAERSFELQIAEKS